MADDQSVGAGRDNVGVAEHRYVGQWWLPGAVDRRVGGVLQVDDPGKIHLELTDELHAGKLVPVIHGEANGRRITLFDVMPANGGSMHVGGLANTITEHASAAVCLVGEHLESASEKCFCAMKVGVSHLTAWTRRSGVHWTRTYYSHPKGGGLIGPLKQIDYEFTCLKSVGCEYDADLDIEFTWALTESPEKNYPWARKLGFEESVDLLVSSGSARSWDGFDGPVAAVRDLLTLATQSPCQLVKRQLYLEMPNPDRPANKVELFLRTIEREPKDVGDHEIVFWLQDVELDGLMSRWKKLRDEIGLPLHVLFGLDYEPNSYYENRIFNAVSSAEGFHRALHPDAKGIDPELFTRLRNLAKDTFKGEGRDWALAKFSGNDPGIKRRMSELCQMADDQAVDDLLGSRELWAKWIGDARNAIGHLNTGKLEEKVPEDARFRLADVTRGLLHLVLMNEIGVGVEAQRRAVLDNFGYSSRVFKAAVEREMEKTKK